MNEIPPVPDHLDPFWCSWFVGFVDGEGYLQITSDTKPTPKLVITVREDDADLIREVQQTLNIGKTYQVDKSYDGPNTRDQVMWVVARAQALSSVLLPVFERFPLKSKKWEEYLIWRKAILIKSRTYGSRQGRRKLKMCSQMIKAVRNEGVDPEDLQMPSLEGKTLFD